MSLSGVRLYDLLPPYVRLRDQEEGQPLAALMNALQEPFEQVYADIEDLYRAWFIETCATWQVPYIGDLLGVSIPAVEDAWMPSMRSRVANALAYRRAKGTAVALERVASDVTGWPCFVAEGRAQVVQTFSAAFATVRPASFDVRQPLVMGAVRDPFAPQVGTVAVGPCAARPNLGDDGRRNVSDVSLSFWRLRGYPVYGGELLRRSEATTPARFSFHPLGVDSPLFDQPPRPGHALYRSCASNVPRVLDPERLRQALRGSRADQEAAVDSAPLRIYLRRKRSDAETVEAKDAKGARLERVANEEIEVGPLPDGATSRPARGPMMAMNTRLARTGTYNVRYKVIVDPLRGRLEAIEDDVEAVFADFAMAGIADLGGGAYSRPVEGLSLGKNPWRAVVVQEGREVPAAFRAPGLQQFATLRQALVAWNGLSTRAWPVPPADGTMIDTQRNGLIVIADSGIHRLPTGAVADSRRRHLTITAAEGQRPVVVGDLRLIGPRSVIGEGRYEGDSAHAPGGNARTRHRASRVHLDGLLIDGRIQAAGRLALEIRHCLLAPPRPSIAGSRAAGVAVEVLPPGTDLQVTIVRSICGALRLADGARLKVLESIVHAPGIAIDGGSAPAGGTKVEVERCTVIGDVQSSALAGTDALFAGDVAVARREVGELAHCYLPDGARAPSLRMSITGPKPIFLSTRFGDPNYARLAPNTPRPIVEGGSRGEEIGVYSILRQNTRLKNLDDVLAAYLPPGKTPRIIFET